MQDWIAQIAGGDVRALARAATAIENRAPESADLLRSLAPRDRARHCCRHHRAARGGEEHAGGCAGARHSPRRENGGNSGRRSHQPRFRRRHSGRSHSHAGHHGDPGVFIRSLATRGASGGLARATADLALLLDAAGKDFVLIETVGVGQDEVEVASLADVTVLVLVPGMGDDVQAIKAGIMEIADIFVINKADHPGAERVEQEIQGVLSLGLRADGWAPPIFRTVATEASGVDSSLELIVSYATRHRGAKSRIPNPKSGFSIDHLGIAVKSIEAALGFYEGQLGMQVALRETVAHEKVHVAMLPAGGPRIELLEPTEADSVIGRFLAKRGEGLHHVALRVPDLNAAVERLRAAGARLLNDPQTGAGGHRYVFVHPASTGGVLLELIED